MEERLKLSKHSTTAKVDATRYRSIVSGLRYLTHTRPYRSIVSGLRYLTHTRPNITFAVGYVRWFMKDTHKDHWIAVKRLLRYVKGTVDQGIVFPKIGGEGGLRLTVFSDALPKTKDRWAAAHSLQRC
jgi:hypothetical protein